MAGADVVESKSHTKGKKKKKRAGVRIDMTPMVRSDVVANFFYANNGV